MGLRTWLGLKQGWVAQETSGVAPATGPLPAGHRIIDESRFVPDFPIDIVYTWVDGADPEFAETFARYLPEEASGNRNIAAPSRFASHDELRYSLRSIAAYAPWFNRIFIVTNGQRPGWLAPHPQVTLVRHDEILDRQYLPTFNSHVIESALHNIPGLNEHYLYFCDDVMLLRPLAQTEAFTANGLSYGFIGDVALADGPPLPDETATNWGSKNGRDLALRQWGQALRQRLAHTFQPQRRSVAEDCDALFADDLHAFRANRFRRPDDVLCCGYLYPVAAYLTGRGLFAHLPNRYVKIRDPAALPLYAEILAARESGASRAAACFNDILPRKEKVPDYAERLADFFEAYYPVPSAFEVAARDGGA